LSNHFKEQFHIPNQNYQTFHCFFLSIRASLLTNYPFKSVYEY